MTLFLVHQKYIFRFLSALCFHCRHMCEMFKHNLPCHKFRKVSIEVLLECKKK